MVLTGSSENILFPFYRQLIAKSSPVGFNENYNDSTNFNADKIKHKVCIKYLDIDKHRDNPLFTGQRELCKEA